MKRDASPRRARRAGITRRSLPPPCEPGCSATVASPLARCALAGRPVRAFPLFDAHAHVGTWALFDSVSVAEQVAEMDRLGIRLAAVSSLPALAGDVRRGNDQVAAILREYPDRFVGYAHVNPRYPAEMRSELERCFALGGFRGIKVYQVGVSYDDAAFEPVWRFAQERRLPVLAHTWAGNLTGLDQAARQHPDIAFLAAHAGSNFVYEPYVNAARAAPNLYLDITYSRDHAGLIEHFVATVGAGRMVWGTDAPLFSMAQQTAKVLLARITDASKRQILGGTAAKLFGLDLH